MKEKVAICTLYDSINCGTFLQAWSLKKHLERMDCDVFFVELKNNNSSISKKNKVSKVTIKEIIIKLIRKIKLQIKFKKLKSEFKLISLDDLNNDNAMKYVFVGSDELWNIKNDSFHHYKEFFGYNFKNKKIIAYAPSANDVTANDLKKYDSSINFDNFYKLSCRDKKTMHLLQAYKKEQITKVVDPTMLVCDFSEIIVNNNLNNYILVYGHEFTDEQIRNIVNFSKVNRLKTVSVTKYFSWCDKNIVASPGEFLGYVKNAKYVITGTFHGSVFSILMKKNFVVYLNNGNKILDLLSDYHLENRIVQSNNSIEEILQTTIDYEEVYKLLEDNKMQSVTYIKNAMNKE